MGGGDIKCYSDRLEGFCSIYDRILESSYARLLEQYLFFITCLIFAIELLISEKCSFYWNLKLRYESQIKTFPYPLPTWHVCCLLFVVCCYSCSSSHGRCFYFSFLGSHWGVGGRVGGRACSQVKGWEATQWTADGARGPQWSSGWGWRCHRCPGTSHTIDKQHKLSHR